MAIFNSDFKYHKDTVEKHPLTEEELLFLKAFQTERNTQDTVCQASPRYWVIKGSKTVFEDGIDEGEVIQKRNLKIFWIKMIYISLKKMN